LKSAPCKNRKGCGAQPHYPEAAVPECYTLFNAPLADCIRALREAKHLSLGDIEKRCGLVRPYISRAENGHTIPSVETLEKFAPALEVPMYRRMDVLVHVEEIRRIVFLFDLCQPRVIIAE
jgi:transcriptional regulator with XRE-family HTH domain